MSIRDRGTGKNEKNISFKNICGNFEKKNIGKNYEENVTIIEKMFKKLG